MARDRGSSRDRPPRQTGMGLTQQAFIGAALAAILAGLGVFLAAGQEDPALSAAGDSLGGALAGLLTAPEPEWWTAAHGTWEEALAIARKPYPADTEWPKIARAIADKVKGQDYRLKEKNKERLTRVQDALNIIGDGAFAGMMIKSSSDEKKLGDLTVGARINPAQFTTARTYGKDIHIGALTATAIDGSTFRARVFHRAYKKGNKRVGDVYVILDERRLTSGGGAGMWLFLTPLLVFAACAIFLFGAMKAGEGAKSLARDLDTIGRGRLDLRVQTNAPGEVGLAQKTAARMAQNLQLIQTTGSGDLDEAIEKELDLANQIHAGLLPSDPPRVLSYELEALFKVGRDIGGDYHDYIELDENRIAIILADCTESLRGVPAAMIMAMTRAYLRAAIDPSTGPSAWLKSVNRRLARDLKSGMAVTAIIVVLDSSTHEAFAASAGHRPIVMWRQGKTATINPNGIALGLDIGPVFDKTMEEKKFTFQKNDRIVLYTDGVISAENDEGEKYGEQRLHDSIRRQGAMNSAAFVNFVAGGVDKFLDGQEQPDDITICTLKRMK